MEETDDMNMGELNEEDAKKMKEAVNDMQKKYGIKEGDIPDDEPYLMTDEVRDILQNGVPEGYWEKHPEKYELWKQAGFDELTKEDLDKPPDWLEKIKNNPNYMEGYSDSEDASAREF